MSEMLNQWCTLAKLRAEIEGREKRVCQECRKFGHLVCNCRNKKEEVKEKLISQNKFEVIASRVIQYRVREEVKVRKQETVEEVKCFRYWRIGHSKQECLNIEVEKKRRREGETVCVTRPQKAQQEMAATYVDCGGYKGKGVQIYKNQEQGFFLERQVRNIWYSSCQEYKNLD